MFQLDDNAKSLAVPAKDILHVYRSMRDVQLALPGLPAQEATAFLCLFNAAGGVGVAVVFHLHKSEKLAFYFNDPKVVKKQQLDSLMDKGLGFAESMGFLMTDMDVHLLAPADKEMLWNSLPLQHGVQARSQGTTPQSGRRVIDHPKSVAAEPEKTAASEKKPISDEKKEPPAASQGSAEAAEEVDELLAAVSALRAPQSSRAVRKLLTREEMEARRGQLRENIGRILASM